MRLDLIGQRFGKLTVVELDGIRNQNCYWRCKCDCGGEKVVLGAQLTSGKTRSCGCLLKEVTAERNSTHKMTGTRIYNRWAGMLQRCRDKRNRAYGGRGISVCKEWEKFETFYKWSMENGYDDTLSLDRIDVNGNYCPENCRWVPIEDQYNNTRKSRYIDAFGEKMTIAQAARKYGINPATLAKRIDEYGFSVEDALTRKPKHGVNNYAST